MSKVRIGLIGAGENTRLRHIPGLRNIPDVKIVCVANRTPGSALAVASDFDIPRVHEHWSDVIADAEVDAVVIGTWPNLHAEVTCRALEAGKHVLCEARMAVDTAEARRMLATLERTKQVGMLVPSPFGLKGDRLMRRLMAERYLGEVREIYVRGLTNAAADPNLPLHWRQREACSGVNTLMLGILNETVQRWFGATSSVSAQASLFVPRRQDPETGFLQDADVPDSIAVLARMASGAQCVYHLSGHAHHAGGMRIEAYGSEATLVYDLASDTILAGRRGDARLAKMEIASGEAGTWRVEEDFIAAIRGASGGVTSFADGVKYMAFTEASRSAAERRECRCPV